MEIPPGTTLPPLPADSGLTLGTAIPASVTGLPQALLRPQVIQAVVLRNSPLLGDPLPASTSSSTSTSTPTPTTSPTIPPNPATSGPAGTPTGTPAAPTAPLTAALLQVLAASRASAQSPLQSPPQSPRPAANSAPMQALAAALGATTAAATASPATTAPLPTPTLPAAGRTATAPAAGAQLPNLPLLQIPRNPQEPPASGPLMRVALQWQGNTFDVISPRPLPLATPLRIQVTPQNELILRGALPAPANVPATQTPRQQILQAAVSLVRENLPRQQPLSDLLPVLRALTTPQQQAQLPPPLARAILNLWQALPAPRQLQQPQVLQKLLQNSGSFFEANTEQARSSARPDAVARVLGTDIKAQIAVLLTLINSRASATASPSQASPFAPPPPSTPPSPQQAAAASAAEMVYRKPQARGDGPAPTAVADDSADTLLQQLGKVLEAGLARIHLNQLDAAVSRHSSADPTVLIPTWVMELPVRTAHGHEQIQVRIEEHTRQQEQQQKRQWVVQLAFDLHDLGKLSATLSIVDRSVAATLWAEQERTHRTVQRELTSLRDGLESVGVNVTEMTCRQGIAPERSGLIRQRLVDTHS